VSTQIAVRLPDDLVRFLDDRVSDGRATSRADVVARALKREWRLAGLAKEDDGFDDLAVHAARTPLSDLA
jgi:Arc/MetJ-type ribon-helix-helix transcriptional regulator